MQQIFILSGQKTGFDNASNQIAFCHMTCLFTAHSFLFQVDQVSNKHTWHVEPHHDYFSQQILLSFQIPGNHTVTVDTSVIDEEGYCWKTGPKLTLSVRSYDERAQQREREKQQQQQQQQAAQAARTLTAK